MTATATSLTMYETTGSGFAFMPIFGTGAVTTNAYLPEEARTPWEDFVVSRLAELERLAPSWDSDGAFPTSRKHANRAFAFIGRFMALGDAPLPEIVPLADGGVQVEWHFPDGARLDYVTDEDSDPTVLVEVDGNFSEHPARSVELLDLYSLLVGSAIGS